MIIIILVWRYLYFFFFFLFFSFLFLIFHNFYTFQEFSAEYQRSGCHTLSIETLEKIAFVLHNSVSPGLDRTDFAFESLFSSIYHLLQAINNNLSLPSSSTSSTSSSPTLTFAGAFPQILTLTSGQNVDLDSGWSSGHKKQVSRKL